MAQTLNLEQLKAQRRELDKKIKRAENERYIELGKRYEKEVPALKDKIDELKHAMAQKDGQANIMELAEEFMRSHKVTGPDCAEHTIWSEFQDYIKMKTGEK